MTAWKSLRRMTFLATRALSITLAVAAPVIALYWALQAVGLPRHRTGLTARGVGAVPYPAQSVIGPEGDPAVRYAIVAVVVLLASIPLIFRRHELRPEAEVVPAILTAAVAVGGALSIGLPFDGTAAVLVPLAVVGWIERRLASGL